MQIVAKVESVNVRIEERASKARNHKQPKGESQTSLWREKMKDEIARRLVSLTGSCNDASGFTQSKLCLGGANWAAFTALQ